MRLPTLSLLLLLALGARTVRASCVEGLTKDTIDGYVCTPLDCDLSAASDDKKYCCCSPKQDKGMVSITSIIVEPGTTGGGTNDGGAEEGGEVKCSASKPCPKGESCCRWNNEAGKDLPEGVCGEVCPLAIGIELPEPTPEPGTTGGGTNDGGGAASPCVSCPRRLLFMSKPCDCPSGS